MRTELNKTRDFYSMTGPIDLWIFSRVELYDIYALLNLQGNQRW